MPVWVEPEEIEVSEEVAQAVGGHPLVAQSLVRRGVQDAATALAFLDPNRYSPADPLELPGLKEAADRIQRAILERETILVWGDFDVDGQTATTLLVSSLESLGGRVIYHIPVRAQESHGVNVETLRQYLDRSPDIAVLLTCDTGISAHPAVEFARSRRVETVITDHHTLPAKLPEADIILNPRFLPAKHPLATLPGVGVAFELAKELHRRVGDASASDVYLDLVALGIVADLAELTGDTRFLLRRGLAALRQPSRLGLQVMMGLAELDPVWLSEEHIAYVLAPRLNAIGRLGDANPVVELLTTRDAGRARMLAEQIEGLNGRRRLLTSQVLQGALAQIDGDPSLLQEPVILLSHRSWPAGIIGIIASRLVERFHKPVVMVSTPGGEIGRGSARSIEGIDITAALAANAELLGDYGGHAMAAGFSIDPARLPELRRGLKRAVLQAGFPAEARLVIDGYLALRDLNPALVADLERLAPFGPGNPPLVLVCRDVHLGGYTAVGRSQEHLMLTVEDDWDESRRVVWWQGADYLESNPLPQGVFDLAFTVREASFRGQRDIQVEWVDFRLKREVAEGNISLALEWIDYRQQSNPLSILEKMSTQTGNFMPGGLQIWVEGEAAEGLNQDLRRLSGYSLHNRAELEASARLVIWTSPPGPIELRTALEIVHPRQVVLFGFDQSIITLEDYLRRLSGLVKHVLAKDEGVTTLLRLAIATSQRETTVRLGLEWLQAMGHIRLTINAQGEIWVEPGDKLRQPDADRWEYELSTSYEETAAYRRFFRNADPNSLFSQDSV